MKKAKKSLDYKTYVINLKSMKKQYSFTRSEAAKVWNDVNKLHKYIRKKQWHWPSSETFQKHFKKKKYHLHSQTVQAIIQKYYSNIDTAKILRRNGHKNARYPYKFKKHFTPTWKKLAIKMKNNRIALSNGKNNEKLTLKLPANIRQQIEAGNGTVSLVELGYYQLTIVVGYPKKQITINGDNIAAMDLGLIHSGVITDGKTTLAIVGRYMRSINQNYSKQTAKIVKKQSKCKKYSRRWKKLQRTKKLLTKKRLNIMRNFYHHVANLVEDYCLKNEIKTLIFGEIRTISKNKRGKMSKRTNQSMTLLSLGVMVRYIKERLDRHQIEMKAINEAYTTQTCPACGHRHKPGGRIYHCKKCNFKAFRDEVGAYNILNKYVNGNKIVTGDCIPTGEIKYLRPLRLAKQRSSGVDTPMLLPSAA